MSKRNNVANASKHEPKAHRLEAGSYRALRAFALRLDRIDRDQIVHLTAQEASELGDFVQFVPAPVAVEESGASSEEGEGNSAAPQGAGEANKPAADSPEPAANDDQVV